MQEKTVSRITQKIESIWARSDLGPEFNKVLHLAMPIFNSKSTAYDNFVRWMTLPHLCCQAAGGQPYWADDTTVAWLLFYIGAHIMDSVEDQDPPDEWWEVQGSSIALNVASAFYFSASASLQELYQHESTQAVASEVIADFNTSFLQMCEGQQNDLLENRPSLQQYWQTAGAKSGTFFSLASRSGARLGTNDPSRIENFSNFGYHLGLLIQIQDDLDDLVPHNLINLCSNRAQVYNSLPFVYALEVTSEEERNELESYIDSEVIDENSCSELISLMDKWGTSVYIQAEIEKNRSQAIDALNLAGPESPIVEKLALKIQEIGRK